MKPEIQIRFIQEQIVRFKMFNMKPDILLISSENLRELETLVDIPITHNQFNSNTIYGLSIVEDNTTMKDLTVCCSYGVLN